VRSDVGAIAKLSSFLAERDLAPTSAKQLRRAHIEAFLGWLPSTGYKQNTLAGLVSSIRTFLNDCTAMGWTTGMPANARIFTGEGPRFHTGLPRFISEDVMTQLEDPANVARWTDAHACNVFLVLRETGKRISEVVTLERNPILIDSTGAPCLLYHDQKGRRDGIVPISDTAAAAIADQQRLVAQRWPTSPWLFPQVRANANGSRHYSSPAFADQLDRWLVDCDIRGADGQPVKVTSHQFRHTLATRMLNLGVPQHIVQQMLGHVGADTVSTYARLSDATMRSEFERFQNERINIRGELVTYADTSPTAEAEWLKHRISKALQTLPNGECGRPIQQACPHPNACLTCDDFLTDGRHLSAHQDQLARTRKLIATAEADGNFRMAEMNRHVEGNLTHIIETINSRKSGDVDRAAR
jgi:integrase